MRISIVRPQTIRCTGLTASWCPMHGDCTCPRTRPDGDFDGGRMDDPLCPLHAPSSEHAQYPRTVHVIRHGSYPQQDDGPRPVSDARDVTK